MKNRIPLLLIYSRLIIGFLILFLSQINFHYFKFFAVLLLTVGLLTDIFDGIIARKLGISTTKLRRLDSTVDQIFFVSIVIATYSQCPVFFKTNAVKLFVLIGFEILAYLFCFLKFRKEIATHSIGAKIWTLFLFATLVQIIVQCNSHYLFEICIWFGVVTRIEIIAIVLLLKEWTSDIPTFFHAYKLRKGLNIKRNKFFNG